MTSVIDFINDSTVAAASEQSLVAAQALAAGAFSGVDWVALEHDVSGQVRQGFGRVARTRYHVGGVQWISGGDLIQPLQIELADGGPGMLLAIEPMTGIHGVGKGPADAIQDLRSALAEHLAVLDSAPALTRDLALQKTILRAHVRG